MANVSYLCLGVISMNINDFVWIFVNKVQGISLQTICILLAFKRSRCDETQFSFLVFFFLEIIFIVWNKVKDMNRPRICMKAVRQGYCNVNRFSDADLRYEITVKYRG